ncbi:MAG TPA: hypothetical protein VGO27_19840 [Candidatus Acidoferrum sp.]|jgi:hypothetical protein|nr:hypothetical protein [Candidatus Acidoferrum sp.]
MEDSDKNDFDALMKLSKFYLTRNTSRRQHEWRISLSVWALLAASVVIKHRPPEIFLVTGLLAVVLAHSFLWVGQQWVRNQHDMEMAVFYAAKAEHILWPSSPDPPTRPTKVAELPWKVRWFGFITLPDHWSSKFGLLATVVLAIGAYLLIGRNG